MSEASFRRQIWAVVLASGLAAACSSGLTAPPRDSAALPSDSTAPPPDSTAPPPDSTAVPPDSTAPPRDSAVVPSDSAAVPAPCKASPLRDGLLNPALLTPAKGSVTGAEIVARLCEGGASASMLRTSSTTSPPNQLVVSIDSYTVDFTRNFEIALPTAAIRLEFTANIGPGAPQPGVYTESNACGDIVLCAVMPASASVNCSLQGGDVCPPGCTFSGSSCRPSEPKTCYEASTARTCYGGAVGAKGSWQLALSSVDPYSAPPDAGIPGYQLFTTHGSLDATLVKISNGTTGNAGVGTSTVSLSLTF